MRETVIKGSVFHKDSTLERHNLTTEVSGTVVHMASEHFVDSAQLPCVKFNYLLNSQITRI